ncbi:MAG: hypothetical protein EXR21_06715 [Flavobacteriaceae bacterium]|nr:hypothetical protein [Flavobacteriaceae bacterium]
MLGSQNLYYVAASGPLPINLFSFYGKAYAGQVLVDWVSAQEEDMSHYVLEKNIDGQYQEVATVQAVGESKSNYDAVDTNPLQVNIYRLRVLSNEGTEQLYYTTVTRPMPKITVELKQVNDANTILIDGMKQAGTIKLYAMNGSLV